MPRAGDRHAAFRRQGGIVGARRAFMQHVSAQAARQSVAARRYGA